jgi:hypothetical protein
LTDLTAYFKRVQGYLPKYPGPSSSISQKHIVGGTVAAAIILAAIFIIQPWHPVPPSEGYSPSTYRAKTTESFTGAMTANSVYLSVDNFNGPVSVSTWDRSEYSVELLIKAKGTTTSEAERNLEDFVVDFDESVVQGQGRLVLGYGIPDNACNKYSVQVEAFLPADAVIDLELESSNGKISLSDVVGGEMQLYTSNGAISLSDVVGGEMQLYTSNGAFSFDNVYAEFIHADTSNGKISGDLEAPDAYISTSNGEIYLTLPCTTTGEYFLRTSNGQVDLRVSSSSDVGYDLDSSTSNGAINIDLPNLEYSVDRKTSKEAQTLGFEGKEVQITIDVRSSNGNMDIDD